MSKVTNGQGREFTASETSDMECYEAPDIKVTVYDRFTFVSTSASKANAYIWAIGDNLYIVHSTEYIGNIFWTDSLQDALDTAAEIVQNGEG
jgi:hypothetical protein